MKGDVNSIREKAVRSMRDRVYGPTTDNNWESCKENWLRPEQIKWLEDQCAGLDLESSRH